MTITKKRGGKVITKDIENSFSLILNELSELEPIPKSIKKSATSLIIKHHEEIKALLDRGFSAEQIVKQLSRINLDLSPETLRTVIRNTDDKGNRIAKKQKSASRRHRTPTNSSCTTHLHEGRSTPEKPNDAQEDNQTPMTREPSEKHTKRSPITIDEDL